MRRLIPVFLLSSILISLLLAGLQHAAYADNYCPPPVISTITAERNGHDLVLSWRDHAANSGGYRLWRSSSNPFFEPDGTPYATIDNNLDSFTDSGVLATAGARYYYRLEARSACSSATRLSEPVGAATFALNNSGGQSTLLGLPFATPTITNAASLAAHIGNVSAVLKFNPDTQGFRFFIPPSFGDNFPLQPGEAVFVTANNDAPAVVPFYGEVMASDVALQPGGYTFATLPMQLDQITNAGGVAAGIGDVSALLQWNEATQGFVFFLPPSFGTNFPLQPGEPFVIDLGEDGPPRWPWDPGILTWSQNGLPGDERTVLLQWQAGQIPSWPHHKYNIYRRKIGTSDWEHLDHVAFAADTSSMINILGEKLTETLSYDLRPPDATDPISPKEIYERLWQEPALALNLANQYHEVALAIGLAYLDGSAGTTDYEYYVTSEPEIRETPEFRPVCAYYKWEVPDLTPPAESQVTAVPPGLGIIPSSRPYDAAERYQWDLYQSARRMDGRAYLVWELPPPVEIPEDPWECAQSPDEVIAGYHLYRRGPANEFEWQLVNEQTEGAVQAGAERYLLVQPAAAPAAGHPDAEPYFVEDRIKELFSNAPASRIYATWEYMTCAVNRLGIVINCSDPGTVEIKELDNPAGPTSTDLTIDENHTVVTITVTYNDPEESSWPLRFFISRSPTMTLPITMWEELVPGGITTPASSPTFTIQLNDEPPAGQAFWYRVQVRDAAGNWSPPGAPVAIGLYDRTAPDKPPIADPDCEANTFPYELTGLDEDVTQVTLYRAFDPAGPYQLIGRFPATDGAAILDDSYVPPTTTDLYYRVEAIDGNGNVSSYNAFCAGLGDPAPPPAVSAGWGDGNTITWSVPTKVEVITITVTTEEGTFVYTTTASSGTYNPNLPPGQAAQVTIVTANSSGVSPVVYLYANLTEDYLNTGRTLADLGPLWDIDWITSGPQPAVRIAPEGDVDQMPWLAAFRQVPGGNWMQVTPIHTAIQTTAGWLITDTTDLDPRQTYTYTVLAFSPTSHEILGYWQPQRLEPAEEETKFLLTDGMAEVTPPNCTYNQVTPAAAGMPAVLNLAYGWHFNVSFYRTSNGVGSCPSAVVNANNLFGEGHLSNGSQQWQGYFYGIGVNPSNGNHTAGRLIVNVDQSLARPDEFPYEVSRLAFEPGLAEGELLLFLPAHLRLINAADPDERSNMLVAVAQGMTPDFAFLPIYYAGTGNGVTLVDDNLPWQLNMAGFNLWPGGLLPDGPVTTADRFSYQPLNTDLFSPDNNLGYLRRTFFSYDAMITVGGLQGMFDTADSILYHTSIPAGFVISAGPTNLSLSDSQITGGLMSTDGPVWLQYDRLGRSLGTFANNTIFFNPCYRQIVGTTGAPLQNPPPGDCPDQPTAPADIRYQLLTVLPDGETLAIGPGGRLTGAVHDGNLPSSDTDWPQFSIDMDDLPFGAANLYIAAATFPEEAAAVRGEPGTPMVTEMAWRQLPDPNGTGGDLDPGLNFNTNSGAFRYRFYQGALFSGGLDLYLRRGGMSEQLKLLDPAGTFYANTYGYFEALQELEVLFLDNEMQADSLAMSVDLYLPYPSDVTLPLAVTEVDMNMPVGGELRQANLDLLHKYWNFHQSIDTIIDWDYLDIANTVYPAQYEANYGAAPGPADLPMRIFALHGGTAAINGLHNMTSPDNATMPLQSSEWLPSGDYGRLVISQAPTGYYHVGGVPFAFTGVKLSHYYTGFLDLTTLPDTMGLELNTNMGALPDEWVVIDGRLSPQSLQDCSAGGRVGCGFVLLDGNGAADYFGDFQRADSGSGRMPFGVPVPPDFLGDLPKGQWPVAVSDIQDQAVKIMTELSAVQWQWSTGEQYLNELCSLVMLPYEIVVDLPAFGINTMMGCVREDVPLMPGAEVLVTDLGIVLDYRMLFNGTFQQDMDFGIYFGYAATQAVFRALATHRPAGDGQTVLPYTNWLDVEEDITTWARQFGYTLGPGAADDPVDLARDIWDDWGELPYSEVAVPLWPRLQQMATDGYGGLGIEAGSLINWAGAGGVLIDKGAGAAQFSAAGLDFRLEKLAFAAEIDIRSAGQTLLGTDWVSMEKNRDAEYIIYAKGVGLFFMNDFGQSADIHLRIWDNNPGYERIEGSVELNRLFLLDFLTASDAGVVIGAGKYGGDPLFYVAGHVELDWLVSSLGGSFVGGTVYPDSVVLRDAGFSHVLDMFASETMDTSGALFNGVYVALEGDFPIEDYGCLMKVRAQGELRGWYFDSPFGDRYGGQVRGAVYGTLACLISARGDLTLSLEKVPPGFSSAPPAGWGNLRRNCPPGDESCVAFAGVFFVAVGIGFDCDPKTWKSWDTRWWGDDWCWTFGAAVGLTYMEPSPAEDDWQFAYDLDFE